MNTVLARRQRVSRAANVVRLAAAAAAVMVREPDEGLRIAVGDLP